MNLILKELLMQNQNLKQIFQQNGSKFKNYKTRVARNDDEDEDDLECKLNPSSL